MVIVLSGKNSYGLKSELDGIVAKARKTLGDLGIEKIDASERSVDDVLQAVQSLPFLAPSKLVVVANAQANLELMARIEEVIGRVPDEITVVLIGPAFDKRKSSYKILKKHAEVQEFNEMRPFELPTWAVAEARKHTVKISPQNAKYLVDRIGVDQMTISSELKKMSLAVDEITKDIIDVHTEATVQSSVFDMLDAAFSGNSKRAIKLYRDQRKKRIEPQYVIAMLNWQLNNLSLAVFAEPATEQTLVGAGSSPFTARKSLSLASKIDRWSLKNMVNNLVELDVQTKTTAEPDSAVELYLLELATF